MGRWWWVRNESNVGIKNIFNKSRLKTCVDSAQLGVCILNGAFVLQFNGYQLP